MEKEILGNFIAETRKELGMTQQTLADRLHVTNTAVSKWERGLSYPDLALLEPLASALNMTVSELMACKRAAEVSAESNDDPMKSVLDIAHASSKKQRRKIWLLALCIIFGAALLAGLIFGSVRYVQLSKIYEVGQVRFFAKDIQDGNYYVYVDSAQTDCKQELIRLKCPNRLTWESIVADYSKIYTVSYTYNGLTCEGSLEKLEDADSNHETTAVLTGSATGLGFLFDLPLGAIMEYKSICADPHSQGGLLYTIDIFSYQDFSGDAFTGKGDPLLTVHECRGAVAYDYDEDGRFELLVLTKYENYPYIVYDMIEGVIVTRFVDESRIPPDTLTAWS